MQQIQSEQLQSQQQQQQQQQPKRRRYRIPRSCDRCRASKIKCVFQDGQCTACVNARVSCTFANPGSLKERPPTQKDVEHLQARIRSLERLIYAIDPAFDMSTLTDLEDPHNLNSTNGPRRPSISSFPLSSSEKTSQLFSGTHDPQSFDLNLSSLFFPSQLKLNSPAGSLPFSLANVDGLSPVDKIIYEEYRKKHFCNYSFYPETDLEQDLMELYFKNFHPCLPMIHPATFIKDLQSGLTRTNDSFRALCLVMMAVASRFSSDPRVFLDLDGKPQQSLQTAGVRYAMAAGSHIFQPIASMPNLYELQAILLLVVYALGTISPDAAWDIVGLGLQKAQESSAHLEESPDWTVCPILDHLRRKVFTMLYEFDCFLSTAIGKPAYMQESDFDVLPPDLDYDITIGTFTNPFSPTNNHERLDRKVTNDLGLAYWTLKSSFGGLKNLFPLMDVMKARKGSCPDANFSSCIEVLINQLDSSMTKCYEKIAQKFSAHELGNTSVTDFQLISSVNAVTWYHEFRLLTHKVLFGYQGDKNNSREEAGSTPTSNNGTVSKTTATANSHAEICIESARMILSLINRLHERNLLGLGFYWIPLRITNALIVLIISLKKFKQTLSPEQLNLRCYEISLGIQILNALAPSTFLAAKFTKMMIEFYECVQQQQQQKSKKSSSTSSPPAMIPSNTTALISNETYSSPLSEDTTSSSPSESKNQNIQLPSTSQTSSCINHKHNNKNNNAVDDDDFYQSNNFFNDLPSASSNFFPSDDQNTSNFINDFNLDFNFNHFNNINNSNNHHQMSNPLPTSFSNILPVPSTSNTSPSTSNTSPSTTTLLTTSTAAQ